MSEPANGQERIGFETLDKLLRESGGAAGPGTVERWIREARERLDGASPDAAKVIDAFEAAGEIMREAAGQRP